MSETPEPKIAPAASEEQKDPAATAASAAEAHAKTPIEKIAPEDLPKTSGEKFYDIFQFIFGKVFIIAVTAVLAFTADQKYGPEKVMGVPNYLKKFQGWFHNKLLHNRAYPLADKGEFANLFAGAAAGTMILSHGGNFFAPLIKWLENGKENIANFYNKRWGKEGEVEIAHERLKDNPYQTWPDVLKGRIIAWSTVFAAMVGAFTIIGKDKKTGMYWLEKYEEYFSRKMAGFVKTGKEIAATPVANKLTEPQKAHGLYRFGKVLALDLYATTAAIIIWNVFSRKSAKKRHEKHLALRAEDIDTHHVTPPAAQPEEETKPSVETPADDKLKALQRSKITPSVAGGYAKMAEETRGDLSPSVG